MRLIAQRALALLLKELSVFPFGSQILFVERPGRILSRLQFLPVMRCLKGRQLVFRRVLGVQLFESLLARRARVAVRDDVVAQKT